MNKAIVKFILLAGICLVTCGGYAADTQTTLPSSSCLLETIPINPQKNDLLCYLNWVLNEAGFPKNVRDQLADIATKQLTLINPRELAYKRRLLKRNLYIFLKEISQKQTDSTNSEVIVHAYFDADKYDQPWDYVLSKEVLKTFRDNHIFDKVTMSDIIDANAKYCPNWPFCKES